MSPPDGLDHRAASSCTSACAAFARDGGTVLPDLAGARRARAGGRPLADPGRRAHRPARTSAGVVRFTVRLRGDPGRRRWPCAPRCPRSRRPRWTGTSCCSPCARPRPTPQGVATAGAGRLWADRASAKGRRAARPLPGGGQVNPVLLKELRGTLRERRGYLIPMLYMVVLAAVTSIVYAITQASMKARAPRIPPRSERRSPRRWRSSRAPRWCWSRRWWGRRRSPASGSVGPGPACSRPRGRARGCSSARSVRRSSSCCSCSPARCPRACSPWCVWRPRSSTLAGLYFSQAVLGAALIAVGISVSTVFQRSWLGAGRPREHPRAPALTAAAGLDLGEREPRCRARIARGAGDRRVPQPPSPAGCCSSSRPASRRPRSGGRTWSLMSALGSGAILFAWVSALRARWMRPAAAGGAPPARARCTRCTRFGGRVAGPGAGLRLVVGLRPGPVERVARARVGEWRDPVGWACGRQAGLRPGPGGTRRTRSSGRVAGPGGLACGRQAGLRPGPGWNASHALEWASGGNRGAGLRPAAGLRPRARLNALHALGVTSGGTPMGLACGRRRASGPGPVERVARARVGEWRDPVGWPAAGGRASGPGSVERVARA